MADLIGQQFGNYRLVRLLGRGGFAEVYLGQHVHLSSQQAALKILSTRLDGQDTRAFVQEAETIAALVHPHIVRVLDFDIQDQWPFLVMDYAPQGSLRQRHAPGEQVPLPIVVSYTQQIGQGLAYAHAKKIIHRDIKPDNMLINTHNKIMISDFGIATIVYNTSSQIMQEISGTVPYMAPEQFRGQIRPASDQYSLAITIYEWLTGAYPFTGTFTEIAFKHSTFAPAPLREKCPMLPPQVEQVVFTALAKDPKDRFFNVLAFVNALTLASQSAHLVQTTPIFPVTYPVQSLADPLIIAKTTHNAPRIPLYPPEIPLDERKKGHKGTIATLILVLIVVFTLVLGRTNIFSALKAVSGYSPVSSPNSVTAIATNSASVADFTAQPPLLSNITLVRNDALFQSDHSILENNGQVVIKFTVQARTKTVNLIVRALVSRLSATQSGFSPINLLCNGQVIVSNYNIPGNGFNPNTTSIQVPMQAFTQGTNQIELQIASNAQSFFWLYELEVQQIP